MDCKKLRNLLRSSAERHLRTNHTAAIFLSFYDGLPGLHILLPVHSLFVNFLNPAFVPFFFVVVDAD